MFALRTVPGCALSCSHMLLLHVKSVFGKTMGGLSGEVSRVPVREDRPAQLDKAVRPSLSLRRKGTVCEL